MWAEHCAGIFGMVLHTDIPVVGWHFDSLNESVLRIEAYASHACGLEVVAEVVVELIAVAVALDDFVFAVCLIEFAVLDELALISAEAHGAAHIGDVFLFFHDVDDIVGRVLIHLATVGIGQMEHIARELNDHNLHAEADAEGRHVVLSAVLSCQNLSFYASCAEPRADDDAVAL